MKYAENRAALSLVEALVALAVTTTVLLALFETLASGQREVARTADAVAFQEVAIRLLDAADREPFDFLAAGAPGRDERPGAAWHGWKERALDPLPRGVEVAAWREPLPEPDTVLLFVSVRWGSASGRGRRTETSVLLGRAWTRATAALAPEAGR